MYGRDILDGQAQGVPELRTNEKAPAQGAEAKVKAESFKPLLRESGKKKQYATAEEVTKFVDYAFAYVRKAREIQQAGGDVTNVLKQDGSLPLGKVSDRLAQEIKAQGVDSSGYTHKLVDNDIRHIDNSHGTRSREKYPVTVEDIKKIPDIIQNDNDVLYVPRSDGRKGVAYRKAPQ